MHKWMVPVAAVMTAALVATAEGTAATASALVYGLATIGLYAVSAAAHYKIWKPKTLFVLFQLDHSMIMGFIAASTTPIALVAVGGGRGAALLGGMVVAMAGGLVAVWLPFHPPRGFMNTVFLLMGWWPVLFSVSLYNGLGSGGLALLLGGGAVFTVGAFIVGSQRPNPAPTVFGYHEIWHVFVIVGNLVHYVLMWLIVSGRTPW